MKNKKYSWLLIPAFIAIFFYFSSHATKSTLVIRQTKPIISTQTSTSSSTNTMKITNIEPFNSGQYCKDTSCMELGARNIKVLLKGPVVVKGVFSYVNSEIGFEGFCMKEFDRVFLGTLPYELSNQEVRMFCFRNGVFTEKKLGKERRMVSVTIDNFEFNSYPAEVMNWADLVDVKF